VVLPIDTPAIPENDVVRRRSSIQRGRTVARAAESGADDAIVHGGQIEEARFAAVWQGAEQHRMDDAEHRGRRADA
jgi:hypothetical protein